MSRPSTSCCASPPADVGRAAGSRNRSRRVAGDIRSSRLFKVRTDRATCHEQHEGARNDVDEARFVSERHANQFPVCLRFICVPSIAPVFLAFELLAPPTIAGLGPRWRTSLSDGTEGRTALGARFGGAWLTVSFRANPFFAAPPDLSEPGRREFTESSDVECSRLFASSLGRSDLLRFELLAGSFLSGAFRWFC